MLPQILSLGRQGGQKPRLFNQLQIGQSNSGSQRIARVSMAMKKGLPFLGTAKKGSKDVLVGESSGQRKIAPSQSFSQAEEIRHYAFLRAGEKAACAAKTHRNL